MSDEKQIFLNVKPFCNDPQLIHIESSAGCNIALLTTLNCSVNNDTSVKLKSVIFDMYPMYGVLSFGFKDIIVEKNSNLDGQKEIKFELELGSDIIRKEITFDEGDEVIWEYNDIIDNHISFNIGKLKVDREELKDFF